MSDPEVLPGADRAAAPREKLEGYLLNPEHPDRAAETLPVLTVWLVAPREAPRLVTAYVVDPPRDA